MDFQQATVVKPNSGPCYGTFVCSLVFLFFFSSWPMSDQSTCLNCIPTVYISEDKYH